MTATSTITELDIRTVEPRKKHPTIFRTFDGLETGETLLLINDHDPLPLYYQLSAERPGQFEWEYVQSGPLVWKVHIKKTV